MVHWTQPEGVNGNGRRQQGRYRCAAGAVLPGRIPASDQVGRYPLRACEQVWDNGRRHLKSQPGNGSGLTTCRAASLYPDRCSSRPSSGSTSRPPTDCSVSWRFPLPDQGRRYLLRDRAYTWNDCRRSQEGQPEGEPEQPASWPAHLYPDRPSCGRALAAGMSCRGDPLHHPKGRHLLQHRPALSSKLARPNQGQPGGEPRQATDRAAGVHSSTRG